MIARHETQMDRMDIWSKLAAPLPPGVISWRQDGRPIQRDGPAVYVTRAPVDNPRGGRARIGRATLARFR